MATPRIDTQYRLDDNLTADTGRIFLTGTQALLRMLLAQRKADQARGLNTAGFVTGYRGSPLAGVDMAMWRAKQQLEAQQISFLPAINEDLGATIVMGTQQAGVREDRKVDGVFAMWYGKGPGVDRAGDAIHHGHAAGASRNGGVLLIVGDDHTAASSSIPHASETSLLAWGVPVIHPASVEEYELFGLWGWALSRYSGAWVAFKATTETVESGRSFTLQARPDLSVSGAGEGLEYSAREFLTPAIEQRMAQRLEAVKAFSRQHPLDRIVTAAPAARLGIVTTGKAFLDTQDALRQWQRTCPDGALPELRHYKIGLSWPIDEPGFLQFAQGLDHILVIEEKAPIIENQAKDLLYNQPGRPSICGKRDLNHGALVPQAGQLCPAAVATALRRWLQQTAGLAWDEAGAAPKRKAQAASAPAPSTYPLTRRPYFCSGCPHNTSTKVPEGSQALAGVGCHYMATWMDRETSGLTQMGGEGADWIGLSRYTRMPHIFQNMGEGTYFHSGYLAIRQAIAAKANITYKILFNDAVAMTGGQPVDGPLSVPQICQQMLGEGVKRVVITTDDPGKYRGVPLAAGVTVHERHALDALQRELRDTEGVTVLIHDQVCAAEKRRRRKKKAFPDPARRLFINTGVCEGCGDCSTQSNCLSLTPVETPFGRKRAIDQSSCNKDYSCVDGFCPSFVSVMGGKPRKAASTGPADRERLQALIAALPQPAFTPYDSHCNVLVVGIGGTGVITVGAILSMAAHLEGRAASVLDMTGLAQKGGTVISHIRLSANAQQTGAVRIDPQQADVAILCDVVAAAKPEALQTLRHGHTQAVINTYLAPTSEFARDPQADLNPQGLINTLKATAGESNCRLLQAHELAAKQFGDSILANMLMLGFAWQLGGIPLSAAAIMRALELNGVAVSANQQAFGLGRLAAGNPDALKSPAHDGEFPVVIPLPETLDQVVARCRASLAAYQNEAYARQYGDIIDRVLSAERTVRPEGRPRLTIKVAQSLHKLMAYKDEYEVARLFTDGTFRQALSEQFEGEFTLRFHLAPPLLARRDPRTGVPRKMSFGPSTERVFRLLARGKALRGTWLDIFSYTAERKMERRLIQEYQAAILDMLGKLDAGNYDLALELADLPQTVRGFGHIKQASVQAYRLRLAQLQASLGQPPVMHVNNISRFQA
ncbi:indolepyruvate ferredoxin oxidoreductase family protein [Pusillimonas sp. SM2304]|uniref:indolepyruvate ferredoxin oxidoreductase family protein n=1 Tax=Pusillimonas sp. SM2304 TaxID=3073241 RepID=UPI00287712E2|nr:indolepyruvate ferredoxin oxidoreductase family protein [Pusillimonas sp. SM2304]MDS1140372.1 indolepyruvate ferredoxin oxidoreductase family protein [Pusillimonas sp. SM2304]